MMSVIDPVVVALKYETDWALASFWSRYVPIAEFPKADKVWVVIGVDVGIGVVVGVGVGIGADVGVDKLVPVA